MIKILIVDDMPIFLEYLRGFINWEEYGFEICGEAHDGRQALEMLDTCYPDIVLTDITMPYLNGLELAEEITKNYPEMSVILITGNNEFEYARKAVKIGVCDYIIKPFEKEELLLALLKLQDNIQKALEARKTEVDKALEKAEEKFRSVLYHTDIELEHSISDELGFGTDYFLVGTLQLLTPGEQNLEQMMNWTNIISGMLRDLMEVDGRYEIFRDYENQIIILMNFNSEEAMKNFKTYELEDLKQSVKKQLGLDSILGISPLCYKLSDVRLAYSTLRNRTSHATAGSLVDCRKRQDSKLGENLYSMPAINKLHHALETLQFDEAKQLITEAVNHISGVGDGDLMGFFSGCLGVLMTDIINEGLSIEAIYGEGFRPDQALRQAPNLEQRKDLMLDYFRQRIEFQLNKKTDKTAEIAGAAKQYIEDHYGDSNLSITDISEQLLVNQTYLRKMFKEEYHMTLSEYITQVRMHTAKELITTTDKKLSEVAELCGYTDNGYFSNCFKKFYGTSPRNLGKV